MTLKERLHQATTDAMRSGETLRRDTLRMAENAIYQAEKKDRREYGDDEVVAILVRETKTRRESVTAFRGAGREDLATKEEAEIAILSEFLPDALSDAEVAALVDEAIAATGAATPRDMGKVMGWLSPKTRGRADGKVVSGLVTARLAALAAGGGGGAG